VLNAELASPGGWNAEQIEAHTQALAEQVMARFDLRTAGLSGI